MTRAVIYARYSSNHQREASIEDQVRVCRDHIKNHGCTFVASYTDRALSGASTLRPGYQQLLQDARASTFDIVVAEALDRLSRDQEDVAGLYKQLNFLGIGIVTLAEGEINELHVGLKGTMNALYLKDLAQKTRRGLEGRVRQGKSGGGLCYGYDVVRATDEAGEPIHGERRINETHAAVVCRIFQEFAAGRSPRAIARGLNAENIPGPRGRDWRDTAIRGHATRGTGILNNELYLGRLVWNRQRYVKDPSTGKRLARRNPECEWIIEEVPELRIVDDDLWDQVKRRQRAIAETPGVRKLKASAFWTRRRARHLLTGLVVCGACGERFASVGQDYIACSAARGRGTCSNRRSLKRSNLEGIILEGLKAKLMAPDLVKEFIAAFHEEVNRRGRNSDLERRSKERELAEVSRRLDGLIEAIADGLRTPGIKAKLEQLEENKAGLEQELAAPHTSAPRLHPNLAEVYRQKVANLHEALQVPETRDEALTILRGLIEQVVLHARDDGFEIVLVGEIAQMIEFSAETEGSHFDPYRSSVKVVAGARNQRYLPIRASRVPVLKRK